MHVTVGILIFAVLQNASFGFIPLKRKAASGRQLPRTRCGFAESCRQLWIVREHCRQLAVQTAATRAAWRGSPQCKMLLQPWPLQVCCCCCCCCTDRPTCRFYRVNQNKKQWFSNVKLFWNLIVDEVEIFVEHFRNTACSPPHIFSAVSLSQIWAKCSSLTCVARTFSHTSMASLIIPQNTSKCLIMLSMTFQEPHNLYQVLLNRWNLGQHGCINTTASPPMAVISVCKLLWSLPPSGGELFVEGEPKPLAERN